MKAKLLKRIRKRFGYYRSRESGNYIFVDHKKQESSVINEKFCRQAGYLKKEDIFPDVLKVSKDEFFWRVLREELTYPFIRFSIMKRVFYQKGKGELARGAKLYKDKEEVNEQN